MTHYTIANGSTSDQTTKHWVGNIFGFITTPSLLKHRKTSSLAYLFCLAKGRDLTSKIMMMILRRTKIKILDEEAKKKKFLIPHKFRTYRINMIKKFAHLEEMKI